ncbi:MAG TPA: TatD family hydrolase [Candidatus Micrarchaeia archaeon]|nr:TatD family hydrolase [Candidatus Micrarchaeia archaeon]
MSAATVVLVDSHCHLTTLAERGEDVGQVLARAHAAGVHQVVTSADGVEEGRRAVALAERFPEVFVTIGWHPSQPRPPDDREAGALADLLHHRQVVGVGEVGLDYLRRPGVHQTPAPVQLEQLRLMLDLARTMGLPVVVHDRQAHDDVLAELERGAGPPALLHCFSGDAQLARRCARAGHLCSFSGIVTFANAADLRGAAQAVPAGHLVVETDAPFLSPDPYRGRPNEPARVVVTAARVAALRGECLATFAGAVTATARAFYRLPAA